MNDRHRPAGGPVALEDAGSSIGPVIYWWWRYYGLFPRRARRVIRFLGITRTGLHIFFMTQPGLRLVVAEVILPNRHGRGMRFDLDRR